MLQVSHSADGIGKAPHRLNHSAHALQSPKNGTADGGPAGKGGAVSREFLVEFPTGNSGYDDLMQGLSYARTAHASLASAESAETSFEAALDVLGDGIAYLDAAARWARQVHNEDCQREQEEAASASSLRAVPLPKGPKALPKAVKFGEPLAPKKSAASPPIFSIEAFEVALTAWEQNDLLRRNPHSTPEAVERAERDEVELPLAHAVLTTPALNLGAIADKLRVIIAYAGPCAGVTPDSYDRLTQIGLRMVMADLDAIER